MGSSGNNLWGMCMQNFHYGGRVVKMVVVCPEPGLMLFVHAISDYGRDNWSADLKRMPDGRTALRQRLHRCRIQVQHGRWEVDGEAQGWPPSVNDGLWCVVGCGVCLTGLEG